jgi:hypothetical protein
MRELEVGDIVKLKIDLLGNPEGSLGVVYEKYNLGERGGVSVIFENGEYDGFSVEEQREYLERTGHEESVENYVFVNVMKLTQDFESGVFDLVFN